VQGQEAQTNPVLKVIEGALNEGGAEMLDPISIPGTTQDFAPVLAQALEGDPDGLFPFVDESFNGRIATAAAQAPDTFEWMGVYGTITPDLVTQTGGAKGPLEGAILTAQWQPPTAKVWAVYRKSMKKYASKTQQEPASQNAWLGTILLAEDILPVIEGEVTRESVKAQLDATDALDTRGATAKPIDFTAPFPCGVVARTFNTFYWGAQIVKSGKIKDVKGAEWSDAADLVIEGFGSLCDLAPSVAAPGAA
jgi:hypothetical protein